MQRDSQLNDLIIVLFTLSIRRIIMHFRDVRSLRRIGHFAVVYLVAKPLIWSEAEGDLVNTPPSFD